MGKLLIGRGCLNPYCQLESLSTTWLATQLVAMARVVPITIAKLKPKESVRMQMVERKASIP